MHLSLSSVLRSLGMKSSLPQQLFHLMKVAKKPAIFRLLYLVQELISIIPLLMQELISAIPLLMQELISFFPHSVSVGLPALAGRGKEQIPEGSMPDGSSIIHKLDEPSMGESGFSRRLPPLGGSGLLLMQELISSIPLL